MAKRVFLSCFLALVVCGLSFYLASFAGVMYTNAVGPLDDSSLQWALRHVALPASLALGALVFGFAFRRFGNTAAGAKNR
jgi:predicted MFS family arabinose efflux permease